MPYIIDRVGNRRRVAPDYQLRDGERLAGDLSFVDGASDDRARGSGSGGDVKAIVDGGGRLSGHAPGFLYAASALVADAERTKQLQDAAAVEYEKRRARLSSLWKAPRPT